MGGPLFWRESMRYLYHIHDKRSKKRVDTTTRIEDFENNYCNFEEYFVKVWDMTKDVVPLDIYCLEDWISWREKLERDSAWKPSKVMDKEPLKTGKKEEVFELPEKNHSYFVEDDGFHENPCASYPEVQMMPRDEKAKEDFFAKLDAEALADELAKNALKQVRRSAIFEPGDDRLKEDFFSELMQDVNKGELEAIKDQIDPNHYQNFIEDLQWIEAEFRKPQFRNNPDAVKGALIFQVDKYLGRRGMKDEELQEFLKALWYLKFLVAYMKGGYKPIYVSQIDDLIKGKIKDPDEGVFF
jgi:hypothetical protein